MTTVITDFTRFEQLMMAGEDREHALKRLAKHFHPDRHPDNQVWATKMMQHINALYQGTAHPDVQVGKWTVQAPLTKGDISNLYYTSDKHVFKITDSRTNNDLMERERDALNLIWKEESRFSNYVPKLAEAGVASGRRFNVMTLAEDCISLDDIVGRMGQLDFRHIVWIMNRLLSCLGYVHRHGIIHGAITPEHLLYHPGNHTMVLVDWCFSTKMGEIVPAYSPKFKDMCAPEILLKRNVGVATDLYMAARCMWNAASFKKGSIPDRFKSIFDWCVIDYQGSRPHDAWKLQDLWRKAAKEVYGEPKFVPLTVPAN